MFFIAKHALSSILLGLAIELRFWGQVLRFCAILGSGLALPYLTSNLHRDMAMQDLTPTLHAGRGHDGSNDRAHLRRQGCVAGSEARRGHDYDGAAKVMLSGHKRGLTPTMKRELKRRSAIEPMIGHAKCDGRLGRNWLLCYLMIFSILVIFVLEIEGF